MKLSSLVLCTALLFLSSVAIAASEIPAGYLRVEAVSGAVKLRAHDKWQSPRVGMDFGLPAVVSTGDGGSIKLRQGETLVSVASNTALEFYSGPEVGSLLQRVVQNQGSAFYDVAPRESNKLRVETPYLVAVIKGTEFDVTIAAETTSISLFEGRLQIEAPDIGDIVQLFEGQIAKRHKNDSRITVLSMDDGQPQVRIDRRSAASDGSGGDGRTTSALPDSTGIVDADTGVRVGPGEIEADGGIRVSVPGTGVEADVDAGINAGKVELGGTASAELPGTSVDLGLTTSVDLGAGTLDAGVDTGLDLGGSTTTLGLDTGIDLGSGDIGVGLESSLDLGGTDTGLGLDAGVDLGTGDIGVGLESSLELGGTDTGLGLDAGIDLGSGDIGVGLESGLELGGIDTGLGLDAGVDLGTGDLSLDLGADTGIVELDLGLGGEVDADLLDLEIGGLLDEPGTETLIPIDEVEDLVPDLGGLPGL
jgi:hypothetical protein